MSRQTSLTAYGVALVWIAAWGCTCDDSLGILKATVEVEPAQLDFGLVPVNSTKELEITIRNRGSFQLTVETFSATGPFIAPTGTATVATFGEITVRVGFRPPALGEHSGVLTIKTDLLENGTIEVPLSGTGIEAAVTVEPQLVDFGEVLWVTRTARQSAMVTVSNPGSDNFELTGIELTDDGQGAFGLEPGGVQTTYAPGDSSTFMVSYLPNMFGDASGTVRITTTAPAAPEIVVALQGKAVGPQMEICASAANMPELCTANGEQPKVEYGMIARDGMADGTVRILNPGDRDLTVSQIFLTGRFEEFTFDPHPDTVGEIVIPPGEESQFAVTYIPQDYAFDAAIMSFSSDSATRGLASVRVEGGVARATIEVEPRRLTFRHVGNVPRGASPVNIFNCGQEMLIINAVSVRQISGPTSALSLDGTPAPGTAVAPQDCSGDPPAGFTFDLVFNTEVDGNYVGEITIESSDPLEPTVNVEVLATRS